MPLHFYFFTPAFITLTSYLSVYTSCAIFFLFSTPPLMHLYDSNTLHTKKRLAASKAKSNIVGIDTNACFLQVLKAVH